MLLCITVYYYILLYITIYYYILLYITIYYCILLYITVYYCILLYIILHYSYSLLTAFILYSCGPPIGAYNLPVAFSWGFIKFLYYSYGILIALL